MITVHICSGPEREVHRDHGQTSGYCIPLRESHEPSGFSALKRIDDSVIAPGIVFDRHSHRNVEIFTYVVDGAVDYRDESGRREVLLGGEVQSVLAGDGVTHSEANASRSEPMHVIQATFAPGDEAGSEPVYQQRYYSDDAKRDRLCLVATGQDGKDALRMTADVSVFAAVMQPREPLLYYRHNGRSAWLQVARGTVMFNDIALAPGDAAAVSGDDDTTLTLLAGSECELLLFDLP